MTARLKKKYDEEIAPALLAQFGYKNKMEIPHLEKIVLNMGVGEATEDRKALEGALKDMEAISGQKPVLNSKMVRPRGTRQGGEAAAEPAGQNDRLATLLKKSA